LLEFFFTEGPHTSEKEEKREEEGEGMHSVRGANKQEFAVKTGLEISFRELQYFTSILLKAKHYDTPLFS
jgi:hypothetical protein